MLSIGKPIFVHISRIKRCTANLDQIKNHVGIEKPTPEQEEELFQEISHIDGLMSEDNPNDLPKINNDLTPIPELTDQTEQLAEQSAELPVQTDHFLPNSNPALTSLSKDEIEKNQVMIEEQLNLE